MTTQTAPTQVDTVPSSLTDDGLEEAFDLELGCEAQHPQSWYPECSVTVEWRRPGSPCGCMPARNVCQKMHDYIFLSKEYFLVCRNGHIIAVEDSRKGLVRI